MKKKEQRVAFTLAELLVVLTILAVMATVAVVMTDGIVEQGRFEATKRTLAGVQEGLFKQSNDGGGLLMTGFVPDVGGIPPQLSDLFDPISAIKNGARLYGVQASIVDPDVSIHSGWRGPYLVLPLGQTSIKDGWGNESIGVNAAGQVVWDGTKSPPPYQMPLLTSAPNLLGIIEGSISDSTPMTEQNEDLWIVLFEPSTSGLALKDRRLQVTKSSSYHFAFGDFTNGSGLSYVGPKALRAYPDMGGQPDFTNGGPICYFQMPPGGRTSLTVYFDIE